MKKISVLEHAQEFFTIVEYTDTELKLTSKLGTALWETESAVEVLAALSGMSVSYKHNGLWHHRPVMGLEERKEVLNSTIYNNYLKLMKAESDYKHLCASINKQNVVLDLGRRDLYATDAG